MRIPLDLITKDKYTTGKEFIYLDTYENYQGYYYILNNKFFEGKVFRTDSRELIKVSSDKVNKLKLSSALSLFAKLSNIKLPNTKLPSFNHNGQDPIRYFAKKINTSPILIKEIDKNTFDSTQSDSIYQTISINLPSGDFTNSKVLDDADKQMPGLKAFLIG
jgi:hypothetical protein